MIDHADVMAMLKDYPKEVILKDGTGVTLRPLQEGDQKGLYEMFIRMTEEELWFLNHDVKEPGIFDTWVRNLDLNRMISLVALLEGHIIANAALKKRGYGAKRHIGTIRIAVDPAYRDRRLGTWMLLNLINLAMASGLQVLVMRLVQDRDASVIRAVRKLDFIEEAVLKDYLLGRAGEPHNLVIMVKRLSISWADF